jgi:NAD/NADP transhydrogenase alpha subunit
VTISPFIPMVLTAAGAAPPARVLVMGAGVAGMQCHHHRLAGWRAYDVRLEAAEEVSQPRGRHLWASLRSPPAPAHGSSTPPAAPAETLTAGLYGH